MSILALPATTQVKHRPPPVVVSGNNDGVIQTVVTDPGKPGGSVVGAGATAASGPSSDCSWKVIYMVAQIPLPQPEPGVWYGEFCGTSTSYVAVAFVPNGSAAPPSLQVTPATLAQQAVSRLALPSPAARHNPAGDALVNLATWWWVDPAQWHPLAQRTAAGPVWAQVSARPVRSVWDAGDGTPALSCAGGGTPYDPSRPADAQSTDCSHTYAESSAGQPQTGPDPNDRFVTVTVTVYWQVDWVGPGAAGGTLPVMSRTTRFPLRVAERQTVVTGGSG